MQTTPQIMELVFPPEVNPVSFNWNFLPSPLADTGSVSVLDQYVESPLSSPILDATHPRKPSDSATTETSLHQDFFSYPLTNDVMSAHSSISYASSVQSDDVWNAEFTTTDAAELPSKSAEDVAKTADRRHRRREQNRKAQSNFRQKRKQEVRSLQREVEELRAQLASIHKRGPTANLIICTQCRTFYPASKPITLHKPHQSANPDFFG